MKYIRIHVYEYTERMFATNLSHWDRKPKYLSKFWSNHGGDGKRSLRLGLPAPQPSRRHHTQSLLGPSFHDPRTHHVLESHPERAAPLSRRDDEWCTPSSLTPLLHCASILHLWLHVAVPGVAKFTPAFVAVIFFPFFPLTLSLHPPSPPPPPPASLPRFSQTTPPLLFPFCSFFPFFPLRPTCNH